DAVVADPLKDEVPGTLSIVRTREPPIPFLLLMEPGHERVAIQALNSGADRYVEKSCDPAERLGILGGAIEELASKEPESAALQRRNEELEFLSKTAMDFIRMEDEADIYRYIAEQVYNLVRERYVVVMLFDRETRLFTVRNLIMGDSMVQIAREELGFDLEGLSLPLDRVPSVETVLGCDRLVEVITSVYQACFKVLPEEACDRIERRADLGKYYSMGFNCRDGLYGVLTIGVRKGGELAHRGLVEAFVRQASVALLRQHVRGRLKESEARYRAVVESQQELVCRFRPDGTHLVANDAYCRFFGLDPATVVGSRFAPVIPGEERAAVDDYFRSFSPARADGTIEHRVVDTTGSARWLQWNDRAFFDRDGAIAEVQSVGRDVTERREAEEALGALTAGLERRVEERTAELEAFTYSVSHDLRAPLRAIDGYLGMLMTRFGPDIPEDAVAYVGRARDGVTRAGRFIEGLLALSRLSRQPLALESVETESLVRAVLGELLPDPGDPRVEVVVGCLPPCRADAEMLRHVYQNLLSNALKFTRTRDPARIEVSASTDGGETVYTVADNGIGFPAEQAVRVFDDFARFHDSRQYEGSGIGLSVVRRVVERHGGRCWADGEVGRGADFHFTLGPVAAS
ncbi:MAG TPA: PAS domain S-box protein, partial [Methanoregulaceae archaeon]|nr:PAS domain S-box protein [Methanoregulaceae archaeon]